VASHAGAHPCESATDAHPGRGLGDDGRGGDLGVVASLDDVGPNRVPLILWELGEQLHAHLVGHERDESRIILTEWRPLRAQAAERAVFRAATPLEVGQLMVGDAIQPRRGGERTGAEPLARHDGRGERLGREIGSRLRIVRPAHEKLHDRTRVAVVEHPERVPSRRSEQLLVGGRTGRDSHIRTLARCSPDVTSRWDRCTPASTHEGQGVKASHPLTRPARRKHPSHAACVRGAGPLVALVIAASCAAVACGGNQKPASPIEPAERTASPSVRRQSSAAATARVVTAGEMTTVVGGGRELGDGGPAAAAGLCEATDVALDRHGDIYIADAGLYCQGPGANSVRKVDPGGIITTVAGGTGVLGFGGDGGPATEALLNAPVAVAVDANDNLYISDSDNFRIRKVDTAGTITTVAGTGKQGHSGDGGPATSARLMGPSGITVDTRGNLYVADFDAVRKIDRSGRITTVAGTGRSLRKPDPEHIEIAPRTRFSGEHRRATDALLAADDVAIDHSGNLYIADNAGDRVYKVNRVGVISTVAGSVSGKGTRLGDGGPATSAFLDVAAAVAVDARGNLLIADHHGERIRKVNPRGTITTIAGTGVKGSSAEHGPATKLNLNDPNGLAVGEPGTVYVADLFNARIRAIGYRATDN
jgi:NHL repeat